MALANYSKVHYFFYFIIIIIFFFFLGGGGVYFCTSIEYLLPCLCVFQYGSLCSENDRPYLISFTWLQYLGFSFFFGLHLHIKTQYHALSMPFITFVTLICVLIASLWMTMWSVVVSHFPSPWCQLLLCLFVDDHVIYCGFPFPLSLVSAIVVSLCGWPCDLLWFPIPPLLGVSYCCVSLRMNMWSVVVSHFPYPWCQLLLCIFKDEHVICCGFPFPLSLVSAIAVSLCGWTCDLLWFPIPPLLGVSYCCVSLWMNMWSVVVSHFPSPWCQLLLCIYFLFLFQMIFSCYWPAQCHDQLTVF